MTTRLTLQKKEVKDVRLVDGRRISIDACGMNSVRTDTGTYVIDFRWYRHELVWHKSLRSILIGMLSTHSVIYSSRCTYYAGRLANDLTKAGETFSSEFHLKYLSTWIERYGIAAWAFMQSLLSRWTKSGLPGLRQDVVDFLASPEKWEEKGNGLYFTLLANDPERGAFTEQELKSIQDGVNEAFRLGRISVRDWALVWFLIGTGVRPVQVARMRLNDVLVNEGPDGKEMTLVIPLAKGQKANSNDRWKRKAPSVLTEVLLRYLDSVDFRTADPKRPIFYEQSEQIRIHLRAILRHVETYSERLKGPIPVFPYRFRYTLGTRALALGASDHEVARLLTHRLTRCVQYYRAAMPTLQKPIKDAIGLEMGFIAQAFQGRLIDGWDEATRRGEAAALIRDFAHLMGQSIGACGTRAECHQDAPRACLSCMKFEPFSAAPWEDLLRILVEDMEAETEDRIKLITLGQIEAVRTIIAKRDAAATAA